ncbi:MAG: restriction endonuclease subunit S [Selenomonadaceae bacterium]|nr:restriction endonuclease subunit S [Selenomonadaceae bacterium]
MPKLRFGCTDWKKVELKDIAKRVTRKNKKNETDLPLTISSLDGLVDQRKYFKKQVASKDMSGYYLIYNGEFAYNKSYSVGFDFGSVKRLDKYSNGALSTLYICFALEDIVNSDFIVGYFDSCKWNRHVSKVCAEGARNHGLLNISADDFMKMNIYLPNLEEQKKIADFLTAFDKRITVQQNIIADLEETKKGLLQKIFSQEIRFKAENGQDYPDWEEKRLLAISELITVGIANSATHAYTENGVVMFRNLNIKPNELDELDIIHISTEFAQKYEKKKLQENDMLVCRTGYPGTACIVPKKYSGAQTFTTLIVRLNHAEADVKYVCQYINSDIGKKYFESTQIGGGQKNSGAGILSKMPIKIPCMEEQRKIADFLSTFDKKITAEKQILSDLLEIKKGLLQQMFV